VKLLHVLPRWLGGGPERGLLELVHQNLTQDRKVQHRVLVLDRPISAPLFIRARHLGVSLVQGSWRAAFSQEIEDADIVVLHFWNHPLFYELLARELPACRLLIQCEVAGNSLPQLIPTGLLELPDSWVLTAPEGHGAAIPGSRDVRNQRIPGLADVSRLANYSPKEHSGINTTYLGSLEPYKLHPKFPEIALRFNEKIRSSLIGDASASSKASLEMRLHALGLGHRVTIGGHEENISTALEASDIFTYPLNPASWSSSDKTLQEAMWLGLPPVLMAGTALDGWVKHGSTGFVATDVTDFAAAVNELADDTALRNQLGEEAKNFAQLHFDPARNAARIFALCRDLMNLPKRQRIPYGLSEQSGAERFLGAIDVDESGLSELLRRPANDFGAHNFILLRGEGGIAHYLKHFPEDSSLQSWYQALITKLDEESSDKGEPTN